MAEAATTTPPQEGPDQTLTVESIIDTTVVENKKGGDPHHRYAVRFKEHPGVKFGMFIPSFQKWTPAEGAPVTGEVVNGNYGWEMKRKSPGGGQGRGGKSPEEQAAIQRQHSQHMAILFLAEARERGIARGTDEWKALVQDFIALADSFDKDIKAGAKRALNPQSTNVDSTGG